MKDQARFKASFERAEAILERKPERGQKTGKTKVRLGEGYLCHIEDGPWRFKADWDKGSGGKGEEPLPGVYGRAALGICLDIGYTAWAAKLEVPLDVVEVEIETDIDARATFGLIDEPAGYKEIRYTVTVASSASEDEIARVPDKTEKHSPWHTIFSQPQKLERQIKVVEPKS